ncbi:MarR family transcriptional regulator [Sphingomonas gei]|uniref:MarR family transcriptional regulator n=1 Tax=Sphingomonas gei TaxID=1395960 RepID=A0A4S1X9X4_9SPHN|nr:MarR family winged helix-turn-helix transcriptional regulator [Sphingomonas gei]TGX52217.1 MarR family transcriptional regulator [Sphingomonas gei]
MVIPSKQITDAWISLMRAQQVALRQAERALRHAGLPPYGWYDALWELEKAGEIGLRIHQIERQILIAQSNVSRLIDRLEAAGCVERKPSPDDGRGQVIFITDQGRTTRAAMWPIYAAAIQEAVGAHLTDGNATILAGLLRPIIENRETGL